MAIRTYKYRIYPTKVQEETLDQILYAARWLYNRALEYRRKRWDESRKKVDCYEQCAMWSEWRNEQPEDNPLRLLNRSAGVQVLRQLDQNFQAFLQGKRGYPRFKGRRFFNTVRFVNRNGARLEDGKLYMQNVGLITVNWHRELPQGELKQIVITRKASGWYVCFQIKCTDLEVAPSANPPVGIDVGIHHALALSDGTTIDSPEYLGQSLKRLRRLSRKVARRKKGSTGRKEAVKQLAKEHEHIANQRRDFWHKVTFWLVATYGLIALEDLPLSFMLRNEKMARAAHDISLGMFREILDYKAMKAGVAVIAVNPRNTSQICNGCGVIVPKELLVRVHSCPHCGFTVDRDVNAALNILGLGRETASKR